MCRYTKRKAGSALRRGNEGEADRWRTRSSYSTAKAMCCIDGYWVEHTSAWEILGTEDLKPYITAKDKGKKWLFGTIGMAVISAALAAIMPVFIH